MSEKKGIEFFMEQVPALSKWQIALPTYIIQLSIFIISIAFFYYISKQTLYGAIIGQIIIAFLGTFSYRYITRNSEKIREKYLKKYKELAGQKFWYHYQFYTIPLLSSSLYAPLLLKTDYFLPKIIDLPNHFVSNSLLPYYIIIPLGLFIAVIGYIIRKPSGGFAADVEAYFYVLYPNKGKLISKGKYNYIRNPRYLGRGILALGIALLANNILAIIVAFIHFLAFASLIPSETKELSKRFGKNYDEYKRKVPALIPKYGNYKNFLKSTFLKSKEKS